jgi:hypothetical protein
MSHRFRFLICITLFFAFTDGHWAVMQSVAWARMVQQYSQTTSLANSLRDTFSGKKPCSMCEQIVAARSNRPNQAPGARESSIRMKLDPFALAAKALCPLPRVGPECYMDLIVIFPKDVFDGPPSPIPSLLAA